MNMDDWRIDEVLFLGFKGSRDYVHGTDIFNSCENLLNGRGLYIGALSLRKMTSSHLAITDSPISSRQTVGTVEVVGPTEDKGILYLQEVRPATERRAYDENLIADRALLIGPSASIERMIDFTVIENIVAVKKKLCYALSPIEKGKWVFAQLRLSQKLPSYFDTLTITRTSKVGSVFSKSDINIDGKLLGQIAFCVEGR